MKFQPAITLLIFALALSGCGGGTSTGNPEVTVEDTSASGAAAGAAGGTLSGSGAGGTLAFLEAPRRSTFWNRAFQSASPLASAYAAASCPTVHSSPGNGCDATGTSMWLTYGDCSFGGGSAEWTGTQALFMPSSSNTAVCGTLPYPGANGTLIRQAVTASGSNNPGMLVVRNSYGTSATIDDRTANLGNFDQQPVTAILNGGYGSSVAFDGTGARTSITVAHRVKALGVIDESVTGSLAIAETAGSTRRTIQNGSTLTVFHNSLQVVGTSTFQDIVHQDGCCLPVSGTITTAFTRGANVSPTVLGALVVGKSETLTITGCGTGSLQNADGTVQNVSLTRCF